MTEDFTNPFSYEPDAKREPTPIERRVAAAQATLEYWRDRPFEAGKVDCVQILLRHCRSIGHPLKFGRPLTYKTLMQGRGVLRSLGFANVGDALSSQREEITPAFCAVGDLMELAQAADAGGDGLGAIVVYLGNNAVFGFHENAIGAVSMRINEPGYLPPVRGWRVL